MGKEKVVLVSGFIHVLDALEDLVAMVGLGAVYRVDGSISADQRQSIVDAFNLPHGHLGDTRRVMLLSTKAGGVGINL